MSGSLEGRKLQTLDDALRVFEDRDLNSAVRSQLPRGAEIQLGAASEVDGREWIEAALQDGITGYVLGASARSHAMAVDSAAQDIEVPEQPSAPALLDPAPHQINSTAVRPTGGPQVGAGLGKTVQDLIVTGFGIATSVLTALILALLDTKLDFAVYSFMWWFVIPIGALVSGFAAASGYYFGAKVFNHRPTRLMLFNMISVAVTTYFLLNYLNYSFMEIKGQPVSGLIPFGQYMDIVLSNQSMEFRIRGAKLGETGELGSFGYVTAALQVLGFAVGGLCVCGYLRLAPYCRTCGKYLKKQLSITRYTNDPDGLDGFYSGLTAELRAGNSSAATRLISDYGAAKWNVRKMKLNAQLKLWRCGTCSEEFTETSVNHWNGRDWEKVSGLHARGYLPRT